MQPSRIDPKETASVFQQERDAAGGDIPVAVANVRDAVVQYTKVEDYTTFLAEYALVGSDVVIHYYPPYEKYEQVPGTDRRRVSAEYLVYWQRVFPEVLSRIAEAYFQATKPTVVAQYVPEMTSWWMRCHGYADRLDPQAYLARFFELLDRGLDAA